MFPPYLYFKILLPMAANMVVKAIPPQSMTQFCEFSVVDANGVIQPITRPANASCAKLKKNPASFSRLVFSFSCLLRALSRCGFTSPILQRCPNVFNIDVIVFFAKIRFSSRTGKCCGAFFAEKHLGVAQIYMEMRRTRSRKQPGPRSFVRCPGCRCCLAGCAAGAFPSGYMYDIVWLTQGGRCARRGRRGAYPPPESLSWCSIRAAGAWRRGPR